MGIPMLLFRVLAIAGIAWLVAWLVREGPLAHAGPGPSAPVRSASSGGATPGARSLGSSTSGCVDIWKKSDCGLMSA